MDLASLHGSILDGKYQLDRQLGKGGMGAVFLATHLGTLRTVAVKVISPHLAGHDEFFLRFQREAEATGRLRHPNVVNVTDFGVTTVANEELAYLVMEYLDGQTLSDYQNEHPRPTLSTILDIVDQVALALETAHAAGIVHRDLKPDNIWLESDRRGGYNVKVLDFGIAKLADPVGTVRARTGAPSSGEPAPTSAADANETLAMPQAAVELTRRRSSVGVQEMTIDSGTLRTTVGSVMGTPTYMAPEQWQGPTLDHRADIYSLAVIAYQLLCGQLPFQGRTPTELLDLHLHVKPESPRKHDESIPAALSRVVLAGLEKDPERRPPTAATFAALLRANAEAELSVLRKSKDLVHVRPQFFLPLMAFGLVSVLPLLAMLRLLLRPLNESKRVPAAAILAVLDAGTFALVLVYFHLYKAASALAVRNSIEAGQFRGSKRLAAAALLRGAPSFLRTQLAALLDLRPASFVYGVLWPVVWVMEDKSGNAALRRSRDLYSGLPGAFRGLAIREYSVALICILMFPTILAVTGNQPADLARVILGDGAVAWFLLFYPLIFTMIYMGYGPGALFLYWSALRCRNEGLEPALPESGGEVTRKGASVRPGTLWWAAIPIIMAAAMIVLSLLRGRSALFEDAATDGRSASILRLIRAGSPVDRKDLRGWTALMEAVATGQASLAGELLSHGANVNARNRDGATPLWLAANNNRTELAATLLSHGATIDAANDDGRTPLMLAAMRGNTALVVLLLQHGADRAKTDMHGKTALDYAREEDFFDVAAQLAR